MEEKHKHDREIEEPVPPITPVVAEVQFQNLVGGDNMINSIAIAPQTVNPQGTVLFSADRVRSRRCGCECGGWLFHDLGSGQFILTNNRCDCAVFEILFNANVTSATTGALPFVIQSNGEAIGGTEMDYTVATANTYGNVSASTLVRVPSGASVTISVKNISTLIALVKDANIIIKKIA